MKTASRPPLRRLAALDGMIRAGDYPNAPSAARRLEVHERTIHRDLEFLRDSLGAPLEFCHRRNGYYYRERDFVLPLLRLTEGELVALFLGERLLHEYRATPYAAALAAAFRKLTAQLDEAVTIEMAHLDDAFSFRHQPATPDDVETFQKLSRAVVEGRQLEIVYYTAARNKTGRRVVDPYHLACVDGCWYLIAYCHRREDVLIFVPGRIRSMRETGQRFERPADFRIAAYLDVGFRVLRGDGRLHQVKVRFAPAVAQYIREKIWHPTQRSKECKDGGVELTIEVSHLLEVKRWVLSWGADCEVLEPAELREAVAGQARKTSLLYQSRAVEHT